MRHVVAIVLGLIIAAVAGMAACSSDPCEDLQGQAEPCADEVVKKMAMDLVEKDDKNQCRLYRDAWYVTYQPRCDSGGADAGAAADAGTADDGAESDGGSDFADASSDGPVTGDGGESDAGAAD